MTLLLSALGALGGGIDRRFVVGLILGLVAPAAIRAVLVWRRYRQDTLNISSTERQQMLIRDELTQESR